ncbi:hypothetical protein [Nocardia gipuzkoensis]
MSAAMERREPGQVFTLVPSLSVDDLPAEDGALSSSWRSGGSHPMKRGFQDSLYALLRAEHDAPQPSVARSTCANSSVHMMRNNRRNLAAGDLGKLAQRVGVVSV